MRSLVFALLVIAVRATVPLAPQDQTTLAPMTYCSGTLTPDDFGPNNLTDYFCRDYLHGIVNTGLGIEVSVIIVQSGWFPNPTAILQFYDDKVRDSLLDFHYDTYCSYEVKVFQACSSAFRACNEIGEGTYEVVDPCYETCLYLHPCLHQSCTDLPPFDPDNVTHCIVPPEYDPASASTLAMALVALLL